MATAADPGHMLHAKTGQDALDRLHSGPDGLSAAEAARRPARHGPNRLP